VRYTHAVLRSALDQARRWKLLTTIPAADMPLALSDKREFQVFKPEEAQRFAAFCHEDPAGLVFLAPRQGSVVRTHAPPPTENISESRRAGGPWASPDSFPFWRWAAV
jgi:hypothetical protein